MKEGIWMLLYPIAWVGNVADWFRDELPHRLGMARVPFYIIGSNWSVEHDYGKWDGYGYSTIYGPGGIQACNHYFD